MLRLGGRMMVPKFRAWDKAQNKMLLPDNIEFIYGQAYWAEASTDGNGSYSNDGKVDGIGALLEGGIDALFELEQYTGLKDANGKEIYEGDLLKFKILFSDDDYEVGQVTWSNQDAGFVLECFNLRKFALRAEIVGNVHENPELLEAQHE